MTDANHQHESSLFVCLPADLICDLTISADAFRLYALVSGFFRKSGYAFASNSWYSEKLSMNERSVRRYLDQLEEAGYIVREVFKEGMLTKRRIWHPESYRKYSNKICDPDCGVRVEPDTVVRVDPVSAVRHNKKEIIINKKEEEYIRPNSVHNSEEPPLSEASRSAKAPLSADASEIYDHFLKKIRERKPDFKEPNRKIWISDLDKMLRIDNRSVQTSKDLISWICQDDFWFKNILSPSKLRAQFDRLEVAMDLSRQKQQKTKQEEPNKKKFYELRKRYPEKFKNIVITFHGILDKRAGKDADWSLPEQSFCEALAAMTGGKVRE